MYKKQTNHWLWLLIKCWKAQKSLLFGYLICIASLVPQGKSIQVSKCPVILGVAGGVGFLGSFRICKMARGDSQQRPIFNRKIYPTLLVLKKYGHLDTYILKKFSNIYIKPHRTRAQAFFQSLNQYFYHVLFRDQNRACNTL